MKKVLAVSFMVIMVLCMSFSAYAKKGEFVQSPSNNKAPVIVGSSCVTQGCNAKIVITSFQDRDDLSEEAKQSIEDAYKDIANAGNLTDLCADLSDLAKELNVSETNFSVSDLFNLDHTDCDDHSNHEYFDITIKSDTFKNFVSLMYYTADGWKTVKNAKVKMVNGEYHLIFSTDEFGAFAIVVNSALVAEKNPHTGDNNVVYICAAVMAVSAFAVLATAKKTKKQTV